MPRPATGKNEEVGEIVSNVLGDMSLDTASGQLNYQLSRTPLADLKKGKVGWEATLRTFAEGFWQRIAALYGVQVRERFGEVTRETVSDWLAEKAGFGLRHAPPAAKEELTYETELEEVNVRQFAGARELPDDDVEILNEMMRAAIAAARRRRGIE